MKIGTVEFHGEGVLLAIVALICGEVDGSVVDGFDAQDFVVAFFDWRSSLASDESGFCLSKL